MAVNFPRSFSASALPTLSRLTGRGVDNNTTTTTTSFTTSTTTTGGAAPITAKPPQGVGQGQDTQKILGDILNLLKDLLPVLAKSLGQGAQGAQGGDQAGGADGAQGGDQAEGADAAGGPDAAGGADSAGGADDLMKLIMQALTALVQVLAQMQQKMQAQGGAQGGAQGPNMFADTFDAGGQDAPVALK